MARVFHPKKDKWLSYKLESPGKLEKSRCRVLWALPPSLLSLLSRQPCFFKVLWVILTRRAIDAHWAKLNTFSSVWGEGNSGGGACHANQLLPISHSLSDQYVFHRGLSPTPGWFRSGAVDRRAQTRSCFSGLGDRQNHPVIAEKIQIPRPRSDLLKWIFEGRNEETLWLLPSSSSSLLLYDFDTL